MRYNKADIQSTAIAAVKLVRKDGRVRYIEATAYGWHLGTRKPHADAYYIVGAHNAVSVVKDLVTGKVTERALPMPC